MYNITNRIIHGSSYWVKLHLPSGKEIRVKVAEDDLRDIVDAVYQDTLELKIGEEYGLD